MNLSPLTEILPSSFASLQQQLPSPPRIFTAAIMSRATHSNSNTNGYVPTFKERKNLAERMRMVQEIKRQQPDKVPIIIERFESERNLPILDHCKYLIPAHITVADVMQIIRKRLQLHPDQAFFLLINEKSMVSVSMTVGQLYQMEQEADGFLYIVYASQPAFGG